MNMPRRLGFVRGSLLALVPLGAFLVGPALAAFAPVGVEERALLSAMPTTLPLIALGVVALLAYRRTRSATTATLVTAGAFAAVVVGAFVFLLAIWPTGS